MVFSYFFRHGWIDYVDICKKSDFSASATSFVWKLQMDSVIAKVKEDCCRSILNLNLRYCSTRHLFTRRKIISRSLLYLM